MLSMDFIAEIRRRHFVSGESISSLARSLNLSRPTVRKALKTEAEPVYQRQHQPLPKLGEFQAQLLSWLEDDAKLPKRQRRTAQRLFECLQAEGYQGSSTVPCNGVCRTGNSRPAIVLPQHKRSCHWPFRPVKPVSSTGAMKW